MVATPPIPFERLFHPMGNWIRAPTIMGSKYRASVQPDGRQLWNAFPM